MSTIANLWAGFWGRVNRYPARAQAIVVSVISVGTAFGLGWDATQVGAVTAFSAAIFAFLTEQNVPVTIVTDDEPDA